MRRGSARKKRSAKKKVLLIITTIIAIFFIAGVGTFGYFWTKLNSVKKEPIKNVEISDEGKDLESKYKDEHGKEIINIALFGLDSRSLNGDDSPRSDSIMVLTLDKGRKKIKLSSIIRDSYVDIKGRGMDKINHAYHFGGPELAVSTINKNFGLAIKDFAAINFYGLGTVIDNIGGVDVDITSEELKYINNYINEIARIEKVKPTPVTRTGKQTLNGLQSVAYCRIRYTSGGDHRRAERQRYILSEMLKKVKNVGPTKYPELVSELLPNVKTSLGSGDIVKLGLDVMSMDIGNIEQKQFPANSRGQGKMIKGIYYFVCDLEGTKGDMQNYIYKDISK
ncbi:LCP family protein [Hathewaya histolytica]|uniref:LCP family protein n=1 Tax=Hathewaya histolytica TaxID=1498 RepID=UPI003B67E49E